MSTDSSATTKEFLSLAHLAQDICAETAIRIQEGHIERSRSENSSFDPDDDIVCRGRETLSINDQIQEIRDRKPEGVRYAHSVCSVSFEEELGVNIWKSEEYFDWRDARWKEWVKTEFEYWIQAAQIDVDSCIVLGPDGKPRKSHGNIKHYQNVLEGGHGQAEDFYREFFFFFERNWVRSEKRKTVQHPWQVICWAQDTRASSNPIRSEYFGLYGMWDDFMTFLRDQGSWWFKDLRAEHPAWHLWVQTRLFHFMVQTADNKIVLESGETAKDLYDAVASQTVLGRRFVRHWYDLLGHYFYDYNNRK